MDENTHVYCTDCEHFNCSEECCRSIASRCNACVCNNCFCLIPEDSVPFKDRPNYKERKDINNG